jgi:hypothetical protein
VKPTVWRDAVRDSDLDTTAKVVAFTLSTYMNGGGWCHPSKATIARGASLSAPRAVNGAVNRLERAGFLEIRHSRGHHANRYRAAIPGRPAAERLNRKSPDLKTIEDEYTVYNA